MKTIKFIIDKSKDGQFYFVAKAKNGKVIFTGETYKRKQSCIKTINSISCLAIIIDKTKAK